MNDSTLNCDFCRIDGRVWAFAVRVFDPPGPPTKSPNPVMTICDYCKGRFEFNDWPTLEDRILKGYTQGLETEPIETVILMFAIRTWLLQIADRRLERVFWKIDV